jgi:hypothetical protein
VALQAEILVLRLYRLAPKVLEALKIITPETVIRWHRTGFRVYWRWKSRPHGGRPLSGLADRAAAASAETYAKYIRIRRIAAW